MNSKLINTNFIVISFFILIAASGRLITNEIHLWNFAPIAAIGLFAGANFKNKYMAFFVPITAMFITDFILGLHKGMIVIYLTFAAITCIGFYLRNHYKTGYIIGASLVSSLLFFIVTNTGVWMTESLYEKSFNGLMTCFVAAIPFFGNPETVPFTINSFAGDLFYTAFLFGGYELVKYILPALSVRKVN